jgi:hypothetical protein
MDKQAKNIRVLKNCQIFPVRSARKMKFSISASNPKTLRSFIEQPFPDIKLKGV